MIDVVKIREYIFDYGIDLYIQFEDKEDYDEFMIIFDELGYKWDSGDRFTEWNGYDEDLGYKSVSPVAGLMTKHSLGGKKIIQSSEFRTPKYKIDL